MPTAGPRTGKVFRNLIELNVPVNDLQQKLDRALQSHMKAPLASGLNHHAIVQLPKRHVFQPRHQKSSADGMRLYAILPPA